MLWVVGRGNETFGPKNGVVTAERRGRRGLRRRGSDGGCPNPDRRAAAKFCRTLVDGDLSDERLDGREMEVG